MEWMAKTDTWGKNSRNPAKIVDFNEKRQDLIFSIWSGFIFLQIYVCNNHNNNIVDLARDMVSQRFQEYAFKIKK